MASEVQTHAMTADELFALPDDGFHRYELVRGELVTMPPPGAQHGGIAARVVSLLDPHVREERLGTMLGESGFRLETGPDTVRAPDAAFIARERLPVGGLPERYWPAAPDLAVEVVSPSDTYDEVHEKALDWLAAGTRLVLVVHPRPRTVTAYRSAADIVILRDGDTLEAGDVVAGWSVAVAELFG